jgi:hypothetical protein
MTKRDKRQYAEITLGEDVRDIQRKSKPVEKESCALQKEK